MGYLVARLMRVYAQGYQETMQMPIRAFWALSGFVDRLRADEARLTLEINAAAQDGEAAQMLFERLETQAPAPVKYTGAAIVMQGAERDEAGFAELRMLAG